MKITHLVCTDNFAGVERHIAVLAAAQHDQGHEVTVIGGDVDRMRTALGRPGVSVQAITGLRDAAWQLIGRAGRDSDVVATHMSAADLVAALASIFRGMPIVSTRHFAAGRGSRAISRAVLRLIARRVDAEIAVSAHIAESVEGETTIIMPGIRSRPDGLPVTARDRTVLLVQRLESEKDTDVGIRAFAASGLAGCGWRLLLAGEGAERPRLETLARDLGVAGATTFLGHHNDVAGLISTSGIFLAPCGVEGFGLAVVEAMASGLPVVASAAGGHLETIGSVVGAALFPVGDATAAGDLLAALAADPARRTDYGAAMQHRQRTAFSVTAQAEATEELYRHAIATRGPRATTGSRSHRDLVVVSLEPWDEVWRRNQYLITGLLHRDPDLRVLFVEPVADPLHMARLGAWPRAGQGLRRGPHLPGIDPERLWLHQPTKLLPRRVDPGQDARWAAGIEQAAERLGLTDAALWVNDPLGAELLERTGWPSLYDITDDWLAADRDDATHSRLVRQEDLIMREATEVVVCSPALERSKSRRRAVTLLRNAVDVERARFPTGRPSDLPPGLVVVYIGTLHGDRLDIDLCVETARALTARAALVLVGPNALNPDEDSRLAGAGILRLGAKDRRAVPGYLQHADVLVVPHIVDDFTDSLDPIKLYEYRAVGRPVVSTPVSGFREAADALVQVVSREDFVSSVSHALVVDPPPSTAIEGVPSWEDRVTEMQAVLDRVSPQGGTRPQEPGPAPVPEDVRVRLGHAAVQWLADAQEIDVLHIKGHALDPALIHPGRTPSDVDVLVRPDQVGLLIDSCQAAGFRLVGRFATSSPFEHSATLLHPDFGYLDVHRLFPGIGADPARAFERLWSGRGQTTIAGWVCPTPDNPAQIALLVLHAARNVSGGQSTRDVAHVWDGADQATRSAVRSLVHELAAETAFAAGTGELDAAPDTPERDLWQALSRPGQRLDEWRSRFAMAPDALSRARLLIRLPLVNTDHIAMQMGRRPTRRQVAEAFFLRLGRGARELARRGGRR